MLTVGASFRPALHLNPLKLLGCAPGYRVRDSRGFYRQIMRAIQKLDAFDTSSYRMRSISSWHPDHASYARCEEIGKMRDLLADWRKWSSTERLLAVVLTLMLLGMPLRAL